MVGMRRRAAVVVLGDLGRSPRMQYHALSLARQAGLEVDVVALAGTEPHPDLLQHSHIHLHLMNPPSIPTLTVVRWACWLRKSALVIDWHNFGHSLLALTLGSSHPLVKIYSWYERQYGKMADGHLCVTKAMQHELAENWGVRATVLYDRPPEFFRPISLREKHELFCKLDAALTQPVGVYDCFGDELVQVRTHIDDINSHEGTEANPDHMSAGPSTRRLLRGHQAKGVGPARVTELGNVEVGEDGKGVLQAPYYVGRAVEYSLFTTHAKADEIDIHHSEIHEDDYYLYREGRPALIVSSTSWTADEDFGILLEAALMYDRRVAALLGENDAGFSHRRLDVPFNAGTRSPFPRLLFVVTGKGPMRAMYEERIKKLRLGRVAFRTMWLSADDYPRLLGAADLGVCLHTSSSGLDLPMKVVDMFGCGLPVCAVSYSCIGELVKDRQNGLLFSSTSPSELADQLMDLFKGFPDACDLLGTLKSGAQVTGSSSRWDDEWREHVLPVLSEIASKGQE